MPLIFSFWRYAIEHGRRPKPVWAIIDDSGYIFGWCVSKRVAASRIPTYSPKLGTLSLVRICPNV